MFSSAPGMDVPGPVSDLVSPPGGGGRVMGYSDGRRWLLPPDPEELRSLAWVDSAHVPPARLLAMPPAPLPVHVHAVPCVSASSLTLLSRLVLFSPSAVGLILACHTQDPSDIVPLAARSVIFSIHIECRPLAYMRSHALLHP